MVLKGAQSNIQGKIVLWEKRLVPLTFISMHKIGENSIRAWRKDFLVAVMFNTTH